MALNESSNRRCLLGSAHPSRKKTENSVCASAFAKAEEELTLGSFLIVGDEYDYPKEDKVPAGYYLSKIADARVRKKRDGRLMLDIFYDIEGCDYKNDGKTFQIKQSYPAGSDHYREFGNAMVKAGVKSGSGAGAVIGVTECIQIAYVSSSSEIGSIVARKPCDWEDEDDADTSTSSQPKKVDEADPDFDDFLPDDED